MRLPNGPFRGKSTAINLGLDVFNDGARATLVQSGCSAARSWMATSIVFSLKRAFRLTSSFLKATGAHDLLEKLIGEIVIELKVQSMSRVPREI